MERRTLAERDGWRIVECAACEMVFIGNESATRNRAPSTIGWTIIRREMERRKEKHPVLLFLSRYTRRLRPETNARLLKQTRHWKKNGKLVDFGCGDASFVERASRYFDVTGIELSPRLAEMSRQRMPGGKILEGPVTKIADTELPAEAFDLVTGLGTSSTSGSRWMVCDRRFECSSRVELR